MLLDFSLIPYPHKGEDIKINVQEVIQEFGLLDKTIAITTDNVSNNIKGIQELQLWLNENYNTPGNIHLHCFAHIINLSVKHGLNSINKLNALRSLINFIKNSPKRLQQLGEISRVLQLKTLKPKVDVETRWNSTCEMIKRAFILKQGLNCLTHKEGFESKNIDSNLWDKYKELKRFLQPFYESTVLISGSSYPTLIIVLPIFDKLLSHLKEYESKEIIKKCALNIEEKLLKYKTELNNDIVIFASILDPRLKLEFFEKRDNFKKLKKSLNAILILIISHMLYLVM